MDPDRVESLITPRTKAILPVHVFGRPADMDGILDIATRYGLRVIEDACEALGARWHGRAVGTLGDVGTFAFYPNKQITTGEGGMMVTDDPPSRSTVQEHAESGPWRFKAVAAAREAWLQLSAFGHQLRTRVVSVESSVRHAHAAT